MVFENVIHYDRASALALAEVSSRAHRRKSFLVRRTILLAVGLVALVCGGTLVLFFGQLETFSRVICVLDLILGGLLLGKGICLRRATAWSVLRSATGGERRVLLTGEDIQVEQPDVKKAVFYYPAVTAFYETEGYFILTVSDRTAVILDKAGFTQGTVPEFRTFIQERTGKTAQFVGRA